MCRSMALFTSTITSRCRRISGIEFISNHSSTFQDSCIYFCIWEKFFRKLFPKKFPAWRFFPLARRNATPRCTLSLLREFKRAPTSTGIPRSPCDFVENPSIPANTFHCVAGKHSDLRKLAKRKQVARQTTVNKRVAAEKWNPKRGEDLPSLHTLFTCRNVRSDRRSMDSRLRSLARTPYRSLVINSSCSLSWKCTPGDSFRQLFDRRASPVAVEDF